ncbi:MULTISPECIES: hypothetical protein [unclassified Streptomyces]|uniref:hypothetical protein n=1 Tax=unclassified Streptomyces TaxID=2593676 RepID=UPI0033A235B3
MREEDFYTEQYFGDEQESVADAPLWDRQALPATRLNSRYRNPYLNAVTAKTLLGEYFETGRLPPAEIIRVIRSQSWRDLEYKGGSLDVAGDRLYVLSFRSMIPKLSYVKVGRTKKDEAPQIRKRIQAHESEAKIAQAVLVDAWISRPCESAVDWEKGLKAHLSAVAEAVIIPVEKVKPEYFRGVTFREAVGLAEMHRGPRGVVFLAP